MTSDLVKNWFGEAYSTLAPELQALHRDGGILQGEVNVAVGNGIAGLVGRRIANKLNIPRPGLHNLTVRISHDEECLHWDRQFNETEVMKSQFRPTGTIDGGYWLETTGSLELMLTVDIKNRGWFWRCMRIRYRGIPIPLWLVPKMEAYKYIEESLYRFYVGFNAPMIGKLFSYNGQLKLVHQ